MIENVNNLTGEIIEIEPLKIDIKNKKDFLSQITFNYDDLKKQIEEFSEKYKNLVYSSEKISEAKKDRAFLNKSIKFLEDERKKVKKEINKPYLEFEEKVKELLKLIEEPSLEIDKQVKNFEESEKKKRLETFECLFSKTKLSKIISFDEIKFKDMEALSVKFGKVQKEYEEKIERVEKDLETLKSLNFDFADALIEYKKNDLDLGETIFSINKKVEEKKQLENKIEEKEIEEKIEEKQQDVVLVKPSEKRTKEYRIVLEIISDVEKLKELENFMLIKSIKHRTLEKGEK